MEAYLIGFVVASVRAAIPLLFAALGEVFAERAGVFNVGLEGVMLAGAFAGLVGAQFTATTSLGVTWALAAGIVFGFVHAYLTVTLRVDQIVTGLAVNVFSLGVTGFTFRLLFGTDIRPAQIEPFRFVEIPGLTSLPVAGPVLFHYTVLVYAAVALVPVCWVLLYKTTLGLKVRVVGEDPLAADSHGVPVTVVRYACVIAGGALAALGGASLSLGELGLFTEGMIAGRGFIALASVILGQWNPAGVLGAVLLFGGFDAAQLRLQAMGVAVPHEFLLMLPYLVTIIVLAGVVGRATPPASLGVPYRKGAK